MRFEMNMYDDKGWRLSTPVSIITTYFHYNDNNKVIYETDSNKITAEYTWNSLGNLIIFTKNGVTYYYHLNTHDDIMGLTNSNGNIAATYEYDANLSGFINAENPIVTKRLIDVYAVARFVG